MPTLNATHRKRLARALAEREGIAYMVALDKVTKAAVAGRLPSALDDAGMQAALRIMSTADESVSPAVALPAPRTDVSVSEVEAVRRMAADPRDQVLYDLSFEYEQITGQQGLLYITSPDGKADKYVFGAGFVALGRKEALAHLETLVADARLLRGGGDRYYLIPEALRLLRQVWQGRVTLTAVGWDRKRTRFAIDDKPASDINDLHLRWLCKHRYLEANLSPSEQWALARTTEFGDEVLARNGADTDKFTDGLPQPVEAPSSEPQPLMPGLPFTVEDTSTATVRGLLKVRDEFVKAGRVEWWWHKGPLAGAHGFAGVEGVDEEDGCILLRDENPGATVPLIRLPLDLIDEPDAASQHLVVPGRFPDRVGVTLHSAGVPDATYLSAYKAPSSSSDIRTVDNPAEALRLERTGEWVAEAFSDDDHLIVMHRTRASTPTRVATSDDSAGGTRSRAVKVHKARPDADETHCVVCSQRVKRVPGGQGPTWIHTDSGAVAAPGADR